MNKLALKTDDRQVQVVKPITADLTDIHMSTHTCNFGGISSKLIYTVEGKRIDFSLLF